MHISLLNQSMKKIITAMRFDLTLSFVFSIWGVVVALFISAIMREQQRAFALESKHEENKADVWCGDSWDFVTHTMADMVAQSLTYLRTLNPTNPKTGFCTYPFELPGMDLYGCSHIRHVWCSM